ncbi:MAG: tryptophan 2,3-dioxygenase family protein [Gemmatimonadetes bacterium]|nr:tryptophan 2,3-dioxygenase family protein [Gemmatimonadota bacterium]
MKPQTYSGYLHLDELLSLQQPVTAKPEHDEMLFIVIHQVYELWFKQMLHELDRVRDLLERNATPPALHIFKRILTILKIQVAQLDILETMTPLEFLSFRERLESSSGLESYQFRELEFALGMKNKKHLEPFTEGTEARTRLNTRYHAPSLWDQFLHYLAREGYDIPGEVLDRDVAEPNPSSPEVQQVLVDVYQNNPQIAQLAERLIDLDEGFQEWRYRHVKMAERTIGVKLGTGGTTGVQYLVNTLFKPAFPDLWAIRAAL